MARPQKNTVTYFPLDCDDGKKMYYIEETYGNDGYATFIKLLKELARSEYHYLNLSKQTTVMFLSSKCKVSKEILISIISDLVELEKFDKELWDENRIIWCQDFIDSIQDAYLKRKNKCIDRISLLQLLTSIGVRKPLKLPPKPLKEGLLAPDNPQSKVKESKEEEIKADFNYADELKKHISNEILINDFIQLRKTKKASLSQTAFNSLRDECVSNSFSIEDALKISIEKNWTGFKVQWVKNIENENSKQKNGKSINNTGITTATFPKNRPDN
jgi:hypothetical protein